MRYNITNLFEEAGISRLVDFYVKICLETQDLDVANAFSSFGATCGKVGGDWRHLAMVPTPIAIPHKVTNSIG